MKGVFNGRLCGAGDYVPMGTSLLDAFPTAVRDDIKLVIKLIQSAKVWNAPIVVNVENEVLQIPHRVIAEPIDAANLTPRQKIIYHCIYTRNTDGYIRQSSAQALTQMQLEDWVAPYLFLMLSDYVVQVSNVVATNSKLTTILSEFARNNTELYRLTTARAVSFWNLNRYEGVKYNQLNDFPPYRMLKSLKIS